jgi:hypothetical protein
MARLQSRFRLIVEWWDEDRQKTVRVCRRIFKTYRAADKHLARYLKADRQNYRGGIQWLGWR